MKKIYINPTVKVVRIKTVGFIATSLEKYDMMVNSNNDVLGRGLDFDDEDEA